MSAGLVPGTQRLTQIPSGNLAGLSDEGPPPCSATFRYG
jgi:hypothetical protein